METVAEKKVKYFGKTLPPKCAVRDCWLSDDGLHYYCTDFTCNRHLYRRSKHDRYSRYAHRDPDARSASVPRAANVERRGVWPLLYFRCPKCSSSDIQMRIVKNVYECASCQYAWT